MPSPREMAESSEPDRVLSHFLDGGELEISRWLRMDYLVEDFLGCIARYTTVPMHIGRVRMRLAR